MLLKTSQVWLISPKILPHVNLQKKITEDYEDFSERAKKLLGKCIPKNTIRASQSPINKLSIYMVEASKVFPDDEIEIVKNYRLRHKRRPELLEKEINHTRKTFSWTKTEAFFQMALMNGLFFKWKN